MALKFIIQIIKIKSAFLIISCYVINYVQKSFIIFKAFIFDFKNINVEIKKEKNEYNIFNKRFEWLN